MDPLQRLRQTCLYDGRGSSRMTLQGRLILPCSLTAREFLHCLCVRAAMQKGRCDGSEVKFDDNAVVLVDKQGQPIGTRVFGPVPHELRKKKHVKILTLAEHIA